MRNSDCNGIVYVVQPGDTLFSISRRYNIPLAYVLRANADIDIYNLYAGMQICIPYTNPYINVIPIRPWPGSLGPGPVRPPRPEPGPGPVRPPRPEPGPGPVRPPRPEPGPGPVRPPRPEQGPGPVRPPRPEPGPGPVRPPRPEPGPGPVRPPRPEPGPGPVRPPRPEPGPGPVRPPRPEPGPGPVRPPRPQPRIDRQSIEDDYNDGSYVLITYVVKNGDTLQDVLDRFGLKLSDVARFNRLDEIALKPGTVLKVPNTKAMDEEKQEE